MDPLPVLVGGGGLAGMAAVISTLFLSRSQRDLNLANAAGRLIEAGDVVTTNLQEDLAAARADLAAARGEIGTLTEKVAELNQTVLLVESRLGRTEADRDAARSELERARAEIGGRRQGDQ